MRKNRGSASKNVGSAGQSSKRHAGHWVQVGKRVCEGSAARITGRGRDAEVQCARSRPLPSGLAWVELAARVANAAQAGRCGGEGHRAWGHKGCFRSVACSPVPLPHHCRAALRRTGGRLGNRLAAALAPAAPQPAEGEAWPRPGAHGKEMILAGEGTPLLLSSTSMYLRQAGRRAGKRGAGARRAGGARTLAAAAPPGAAAACRQPCPAASSGRLRSGSSADSSASGAAGGQAAWTSRAWRGSHAGRQHVSVGGDLEADGAAGVGANAQPQRPRVCSGQEERAKRAAHVSGAAVGSRAGTGLLPSARGARSRAAHARPAAAAPGANTSSEVSLRAHQRRGSGCWCLCGSAAPSVPDPLSCTGRSGRRFRRSGRMAPR